MKSLWVKKFNTYGQQLNSHDVLKAVAIVLMVIDHIGRYGFPDIDFFRFIGRFAAPVFLFLVGYSLKFRIKPPLIIAAVVLLLFSAWTHHPIIPLNILFTIIVARALLPLAEKKEFLDNMLLLWLGLFIWGPLSMLIFDYGSVGLMFVLCGYCVAHKRYDRQTQTLFVLTAVSYLGMEYLMLGFSMGVMVLLALGVAAMMYFFYRYQFTVYTTQDERRIYIMFLSRYSLEIYVLHLMLLQAMATFLVSPEEYAAFRWY